MSVLTLAPQGSGSGCSDCASSVLLSHAPAAPPARQATWRCRPAMGAAATCVGRAKPTTRGAARSAARSAPPAAAAAARARAARLLPLRYRPATTRGKRLWATAPRRSTTRTGTARWCQRGWPPASRAPLAHPWAASSLRWRRRARTGAARSRGGAPCGPWGLAAGRGKLGAGGRHASTPAPTPLLPFLRAGASSLPQWPRLCTRSSAPGGCCHGGGPSVGGAAGSRSRRPSHLPHLLASFQLAPLLAAPTSASSASTAQWR